MHEANARSFLQSTQKLRIGLPKGSIYEKSRQFVIDFIGKEIPKGKLAVAHEEYMFYFLKLRDIPILIEKGFLDYGITSDEWIEETGVKLSRLKELDWCDTKIALIVHRNYSGQLKSCVTEYINIARKLLKDYKFNMEYVSGSCEALIPTEFDCCVTCVESGSTLQQNDLEVKEILLQSKIVLVGKKESSSDKMKKLCRKL